jgi:hypothetical protein
MQNAEPSNCTEYEKFFIQRDGCCYSSVVQTQVSKRNIRTWVSSWVAASCSQVEVQCFRGTASIIRLMMAAASTSEVMVNLYQTTWHYNPKTIIFIFAAMRNSSSSEGTLVCDHTCEKKIMRL